MSDKNHCCAGLFQKPWNKNTPARLYVDEQPFMILYRRGNSEELIDRMTDRIYAQSNLIGNELSTIRGEWK
jgi:hypothetical protein